MVGPNGSGKSNVIDSLLFVFGFRASKMRQGKISALIHNSSSQPNLTFCSVEIYFHDVVDQPDGTSEVVPQSTLVVSRKAFKNNSSKYYINDRDSSFTEVTTLMREKGIDLDHKRFLILQGEVESIAQMKPKAENDNDDGLLEYLEDIIGTSTYKKSIEESNATLEELNEQCVSKLTRLDIVKKEIGGLEGQKNEIVKHMRAENNLTMKKSVYYQLNIHQLQESIQVHIKALEDQKQRLEQERQSTEGHREEITNLEKELKAHSKELDSMKKNLQASNRIMSKAEIQKVQFEEKAKHLTGKQKKLEKTISSATHAFNEAQSWITNYNEEAESLNTRFVELEQKLMEKSAELVQVQNSLKGKTQGITDEIEIAQKKLEPWREKISAKESEVAIAQSEIDIITEKQTSAKETIKNAKKSIEEVMNNGRGKEEEVLQIRKELSHVSDQINLGAVECEHASNALAKMKEQLVGIRQKVLTAKDTVNSAKSQGAVLTSLMKLSNSGRVDNFHGRLGALGTIDPKYDVAISTACPSLDNLVVDTVEAGQQCVEYLRKNNIGRAKFILLDRLPKRNLEPIQTPENVPRLFDLIKPKEDKFAPAFFSVLGDTLVAKDPEQARRIAYGGRRWRVVSLQGVLIDKSGTMSGGGQISKGKMKGQIETTISDSELRELEQELEEKEAKYAKAEATYNKMNTHLNELRDQKPKLELDISKVNLEIETLSTTLEEMQKQYKETSRDIKRSIPKEEEVLKSEEKKAELESQLNELKQHSAGLEQTIADLQEKIMEIGGVKLRFIKSEVDGITEQREIINARLSQGIMERTKKENEIKKQQRVINNARQEIESSSEGYKSSELELNEKAGAVQKLEQEVEALRVAVEEKEEIVASLKTEVEEKRSIINKILSAEIEITNIIEQHEKSLRDENRGLESYITRIRELKLHQIGDIAEIRIKSDKPQDDEAEEEEEPQVHDHTELVEYSLEELADYNAKELKSDIAKLEEQLKDYNIDMQVLKEYRRRASDYDTRRGELNSSVDERDKMKQYSESLRKKRLDEFMEGFNMISMKLKEMYQMITMGGNAELELVDSLDPFSEGILFSVMPPKKSWKNISNLSGGEKTLSSLALVFALHHYKPTPLYVMDEIDAALDFRNVSIVANYIRERTKNGQFIVISLRNNMFELANQLVGIYKVNNMTKSIALQNKDYVHKPATATATATSVPSTAVPA